MFEGLRSRCCRPSVRVSDGEADLVDHAGALPELQRWPDPSELEALDVLHDEDRRAAVRPELEQPDDAPIREEGKGAGFAEKAAEGRRHCRVRANDFRGHEAIEAKVAQLEHFAHAAGADPFDGVEAVEDRQRGVARRVRRRKRFVLVEGARELGVFGNQAAKGLDEPAASAAEVRGVERTAVDHVLFDVSLDQPLQLRGDHHGVTGRPAAGSAPRARARAACGRRPRTCRDARRSPGRADPETCAAG